MTEPAPIDVDELLVAARAHHADYVLVTALLDVEARAITRQDGRGEWRWETPRGAALPASERAALSTLDSAADVFTSDQVPALAATGRALLERLHAAQAQALRDALR